MLRKLLFNNENNNEKSFSSEDVEKLGIDLSMINVCKKLRRLAKLERITFDETRCCSQLNQHLFNYISYCGYNVLNFVKEYISNLQPYMIERHKNQEAKNTFICVIDKLYRNRFI